MLLFLGGAYIFKVKNTGMPSVDRVNNEARAPGFQPSSVIVEVGKEKVTQEDIDWEYELLTDGVGDQESLTPIPDLGNRYGEELQSLRKALVANVIERKLLFSYIQQDRDFGFDDPRRYMNCLSEWQEGVKGQTKAVQVKGGKDRLKARLCERSLLDQYMKERLFSQIQVGNQELLEYYKNHVAEYKLPERVEVRNVLLAEEADAKRVRAQINQKNFADMAKSQSIAPEAEHGGKLGPFAKGAMPAVFEVAFHMKKGEISDVLKSNYGYQIIMMLEKYPKTDLSFDEAKPRIVQTLKRKHEEEEYKRWVDKALAAINVTTPKQVW